MITTTLLLAAIIVDIIASKKSRERLQRSIDNGFKPRVGNYSYVGAWGTAAFALWIAAAVSLFVELIAEVFFL